MKIAIGIIVLVLIALDIGIYVQLRKYCKIHENELLEEHTKYIYSRLVIIALIGVIVGVLGLVIQFI